MLRQINIRLDKNYYIILRFFNGFVKTNTRSL